jgi:hypothetical protein
VLRELWAVPGLQIAFARSVMRSQPAASAQSAAKGGVV